MTWSGMGRYFAVAGAGQEGVSGIVDRWNERDGAFRPSPEENRPAGLGRANRAENVGDEPCDEAKFAGYGRIAFSPDERTLASVVEIEGEWADDSIAFVGLPAFQQQQAFPAQGHITDLTWTPDSRRVIYCAAGQAYRVNPETLEAEQLPFGAELCLCHPHKPLCVCFSSWLKNSAKGRLFLCRLGRAGRLRRASGRERGRSSLEHRRLEGLRRHPRRPRVLLRFPDVTITLTG